MDVVMIYFYSKQFRFAPSFNYVTNVNVCLICRCRCVCVFVVCLCAHCKMYVDHVGYWVCEEGYIHKLKYPRRFSQIGGPSIIILLVIIKREDGLRLSVYLKLIQCIVARIVLIPIRATANYDPLLVAANPSGGSSGQILQILTEMVHQCL